MFGTNQSTNNINGQYKRNVAVKYGITMQDSPTRLARARKTVTALLPERLKQGENK